MNLMILVVMVFVMASLVSSQEQPTQAITLKNPGFETRPTNLTTNITSQFELLDNKINIIPGWLYNGTVQYVTTGGNISLPGNGHGLQLGPNGMIKQTFKSDGSYDYVLTFTLAPSSTDCANNYTAVNVSGPGVSKVFFYRESLGNEMWQTYGYSLGNNADRRMSLQLQSVANSSRGNITCWPIVDTFLVNGISSPRWYSDNDFANNGFEVGPAFLKNSSQGILLEEDSNINPPIYVQSPLQYWTILGTVKYIDSKHYAVPRGRRAVELVSGYPSGIMYNNVRYSSPGQVTIDFFMGDANNSCVGDFIVFLQVENSIWNFTMRSIGVGSREKHSVTMKAEFSNTESVPISFASFNETRTSDHNVLCGPVIDSVFLRFSRFSSGLSSKNLRNGWVIYSLVFAETLLFFA